MTKKIKIVNVDGDARIEAEHNKENAKLVHLDIEHYKDYARIALTKAKAKKLADFLLNFAES